MEPLDIVSAVGQAARQHRAELVMVARREGLSAEDAVDCVQDALCTFLKVAQRGEQPADAAEWGAYLAGITRNAARNKRRRHHVAKPHDEASAVQLPHDDDDSETLVANAEEHVRLRSCVDRLCDTQRAVVTLRLLDEQPGDDVAAVLGIGRGHVDVLLHRAKARLRVCMMEEERPVMVERTRPAPALRATQRGR